eukprot:NODE_82_length_3428_cov_22.762652_g73_i0.p1 GENE.NODE_82_length_3428_cov_22.762652_g73_i0~~NODE_82_length_3428_cov_22.762652_g73_i0.p1  ORF type:complete len:1018 (+),score=158.70 NODE_82_length_3428_cov_22.762652_g73_i0:176-3229(+)
MPVLTIKSLEGSLATSEAYCLFCIADVRRLTPLALGEGSEQMLSSFRWPVTLTLPVATGESGALTVTVLSLRPFGDRHCGSRRLASVQFLPQSDLPMAVTLLGSNAAGTLRFTVRLEGEVRLPSSALPSKSDSLEHTSQMEAERAWNTIQEEQRSKQCPSWLQLEGDPICAETPCVELAGKLPSLSSPPIHGRRRGQSALVRSSENTPAVAVTVVATTSAPASLTTSSSKADGAEIKPATQVVRRFLEEHGLGRFSDTLIAGGMDTMEALRTKLSGARLTQLGLRTTHQLQLQRALSKKASGPAALSITTENLASKPRTPRERRMEDGAPALALKPRLWSWLDLTSMWHVHTTEACSLIQRALDEGQDSVRVQVYVGRSKRQVSVHLRHWTQTDSQSGDEAMIVPADDAVPCTWARQDGYGHWHSFEPAITQEIHKQMKNVASHQGGEASPHEVSAHGESYLIDFNLLQQQSLQPAAAEKRPIRPMLTIHQRKWAYDSGDENWVLYPSDIQATLTEHWTKLAADNSTELAALPVECHLEDLGPVAVTLRCPPEHHGEQICLSSRKKSSVREITHTRLVSIAVSLSGGRWRPLSWQHAAEVFESIESGKESVIIEEPGERLHVDLVSMRCQRKSESGTASKLLAMPLDLWEEDSDDEEGDGVRVQVISEDGIGDWAWAQDDGVWHFYSAQQNAKIQKVAKAGVSRVSIRVNQASHAIDLGTMQQMNITGDTARSLMRVRPPLQGRVDTSDRQVLELDRAFALLFDPSLDKASTAATNFVSNRQAEFMMYTGPLLPHPLPPVEDIRPDDLCERVDRLRLLVLNKGAPTEKDEGSLGGPEVCTALLRELRHLLDHQLGRGASRSERRAREVLLSKDEEGVRREFAGLPDTLVGAFESTYCLAKQQKPGKLYLTDRHILWSGEGVKFGVPLADVLSIQKAVICRSPALQIYTRSSGFYQFSEFADGFSSLFIAAGRSACATAFDRAYNYLDHLWRACTTVPHPDVAFHPYWPLFSAYWDGP